MDFKLLSKINYNISSNMVDLPHTVFEQLQNNSIQPPYFFKITTQSNLDSYVGVRQFTAKTDTIEIPYWLHQELLLNNDEIIQIKVLKNIPKGKYIKICPETKDFFNIPEYRYCLEIKLSKFPLLYQGQIIVLDIFDNKYKIKIEDIDIDWFNFNFSDNCDSLQYNVIDIINTDLNVDIKNKFINENTKIPNKFIKNNQIKEQINYENYNNNDDNDSDDEYHLNKEDIRKARLKYFCK